VTATREVVADAFSVLEVAPGIMVRQPLERARNPLSAADYHAVAAPYVVLYVGSSARTRRAFMHALRLLLDGPVLRESPFAPIVEPALEAFASDSSYATAIARAAVAIKSKRVVWDLRVRLRQAASEAVAVCRASQAPERSCSLQTPCGTGACPFAAPGLECVRDLPLGPSAIPGQVLEDLPVRFQRPPAHVDAGSGFDVEDTIRAMTSGPRLARRAAG
jgi:hypothetical protein